MSGLDHRNDYTKGALLEADVPSAPFPLFEQWLADADAAGMEEPSAMTLATVDPEGRPSARIVLLRAFDEKGFTFFTNYLSRKGREIDGRGQVSLVFFWPPLERQVRIEGVASRVDAAESDAYFRGRPLRSQLGAHASDQSKVLDSRQELEQRMAELESKWPDGDVPRPEHWGGYRVAPTAIEFWQGGRSRLHDRLVYTPDGEGGGWALRRLSP